MHLNSFNIDKVVNLAEDLRDKVYVSTRPNRRGYPEHLGPRGGKFYYETNLPSPGLRGGIDFSGLSHKTLLGLAKKMKSSQEAKTKFLNILDNLYGDPSYNIDWEVSIYPTGDFRVNGFLTDKNTNVDVGHIERNFQSNGIVYHSQFKLDNSLPQGIATRVNDNCEELYRRMGYKRVQLSADISVGKYVWARQGYDWTNSSRKEVLIKVKKLFKEKPFHEFPKTVKIGNNEYTRIDESATRLQSGDTKFYQQRISTLTSSIPELERKHDDLLKLKEKYKNDAYYSEELENKERFLLHDISKVQEAIDYYQSKYDSSQNELPIGYAYRTTDGKDTISPESMNEYLANKAFIELKRNNNEFKHSWDLASADTGVNYKADSSRPDYVSKEEYYPIGKALMLSLPISWDGYKPLDKNSQAYQIGKRYAASKRINKALTQRKLFGLITKSIYIAKAEEPELPRTYVSTEPPHNNEPIHIGERGAPYYYSEEDGINSDEPSFPSFISSYTPDTIYNLGVLSNSGNFEASEEIKFLFTNLYKDPSFNIEWDDSYFDEEFGTLSMTGVIVDKDGVYAGSIERSFDLLEGIVHHDRLELEDSLPPGIATALNDRCEEMYRQMGFDKVQLSADISIGKYVWARQGYDWNSEGRHEVLSRVQDVLATHFFDSPDEFETEDFSFTKRSGDSKRFLDKYISDFLYKRKLYKNKCALNVLSLKNLKYSLNNAKSKEDYEKYKKDIELKMKDLGYNKAMYRSYHKGYLERYRALKPIHGYDAVDKVTGETKYFSPDEMKDIISDKLFKEYYNENNGFKHSWDLANLDNGIEYPVIKLGETDRRIEGTFPLGKALMLSLQHAWQGTKPLDKNSINYRIGKTYAKSKRLNKSYQRRKALSLLDKSIYIAKGLD